MTGADNTWSAAGADPTWPDQRGAVDGEHPFAPFDERRHRLLLLGRQRQVP